MLKSLLTAVFIAVPAAVSAQVKADVALETSAAHMHARLSSRNLAGENDKVENVHKYMHQAINCLVGARDKDFDASYANPCAPTGNGVIPDTTDPARQEKFRAVVSLLKTGLAEADLAAAKAIGLSAADALGSIGQ